MISSRIRKIVSKHKWDYATGIVVGILSYLYMMTNKLPNWDEVVSMFSKGTTISSGRWVLHYTNIIFPDFSLPWLWGMLSIMFVCAAACIATEIFSVNSITLRCLLVALFVSFPALISTFSYMFTTVSDALGLMITVLAVYLANHFKNEVAKNLVPVLLLIISLGIYQAYLPVAVSFFLIIVIQDLLKSDEDSIKPILLEAIRYVALLIVSALLYYVITKEILVLFNTQFNSIASDALNWKGILNNIAKAYKYFVLFFVKREYGLIVSPFSQAIHIGAGIIAFYLLVKVLLSIKTAPRVIMASVLVLLLPLTVNSLFLVIDPNYIGTMESYAFVSLYVFVIVLIDSHYTELFANRVAKQLLIFAMAIVISINVFTANRCWLQMQFAYENMKAVYMAITTQINMTPGFDENSKIVFIGDIPDNKSLEPFLEETQLEGVPFSLFNIYSRDFFLKRYLNYSIPVCSEDSIQDKSILKEINNMKCYPYYGYILKRGNLIIVKLGDAVN